MNMVKVIYIVGVMFLFCIISCTKDNYIDTGISKNRFDGNMLEYMESHSYDWGFNSCNDPSCGCGYGYTF